MNNIPEGWKPSDRFVGLSDEEFILILNVEIEQVKLALDEVGEGEGVPEWIRHKFTDLVYEYLERQGFNTGEG